MITRRTALYLGVTALIGASFAWWGSPYAAGGIKVVGNLIKWTGELPGAWLGGSQQDIDQLVKEFGNASPDMIEEIRKLKRLFEELNDVELHYVNLDERVPQSGVVGDLFVMIIKDEAGDLKDKDYRQGVWRGFAGDKSTGQTTLEREIIGTTGGFPSYMGIFRIKGPRGLFNKIMHLVDRGGGNVHAFAMSEDAEKFPVRFQEFQGLLRSIRYQK